MNKEVRMVILEIIFVVFIMVVGSYVYNYFSLSVNEVRAESLKYASNLSLDLVSKDNYSDVIVVKNSSDDIINYNFLFRVEKNIDYTNINSIILNGRVYYLNDLESYNNDSYLYFKVDDLMIGNKEQFLIVEIMFNEKLDNGVKYGYMVSEV